MKNIITLIILLLMIVSCGKKLQNNNQAQYNHLEPTQNFTVNRLIILNEKNEMLMGKEKGHWYNPGDVYIESQFVKESVNSLAGKYGIQITPPKLHGYFSYKYEYHPYSSLRAFYVAKYVSGNIKVSGNTEEVKWIPIDEAIEKIPVESIQMATKQILDYPHTLWGGSFVIYRSGEEHHARIVEEFYPLFNKN